jgi:hypothetical protein
MRLADVLLFPGLRSKVLGNDEKYDTPRKDVRSARKRHRAPIHLQSRETRNAKRETPNVPPPLQILFEEVDSLCFDELAHLRFVRDVCGPANRREVEIFAGSL